MIYIKNIIFDLGGVILKGKPISILDDLNIDEDVYNKLKVFFDNWEELDLGKGTLEEKFNSYNFSKDVDQYKEYLIHYYKYRKVNTELIDIINNLKVNNYNIYILSDNNNDFFEYFKESELFNMVNGYVISCEYGSLKKNGLLFEKLINKYNLNVDECYFIDDNINNIEIGLKYGIKGFVFNENIEQLYDDMRNNNINI